VTEIHTIENSIESLMGIYHLHSVGYWADPFGAPTATKGLAPVLRDPLRLFGPASF